MDLKPHYKYRYKLGDPYWDENPNTKVVFACIHGGRNIMYDPSPSDLDWVCLVEPNHEGCCDRNIKACVFAFDRSKIYNRDINNCIQVVDECCKAIENKDMKWASQHLLSDDKAKKATAIIIVNDMIEV